VQLKNRIQDGKWRASGPGVYECVFNRPSPALAAAERALVLRVKTVRKAAHGLPCVTVSLTDIHVTQNWVHRGPVDEMVKDPSRTEHAKEPAILVRKSGALWLHDGHHRLAAASLRGDTMFSARLLDLDALAASAAITVEKSR
jgi:hypothetical protein